MDINELKGRLKSGSIGGFYIMCGEEDYLKKHYMKMLKGAIISDDDPFAFFNYTAFDGADIDFAAVQDAIKSPPMMGEYKLIEWKFASLDSLKEGERAALDDIAELKNEYPYAVFAIMTTADGFDIGTAKKPSKLFTRYSKSFDIINFEKSTDSQLLAWLKKHFDAEEISVDIQVLNALLFRSGHSMDVLNNEVTKLCCYAKANGKNTITVKDVEDVASATVECEAFALSNAVVERNMAKAFTALADFKQRRVEPRMVVAMLEKTYSELSSVALLLDEGKGAADIEAITRIFPFMVKRYIGAAKKIGTKRLASSLSELARIDAASKSGGIAGYSAIEMFITQNI